MFAQAGHFHRLKFQIPGLHFSHQRIHMIAAARQNGNRGFRAFAGLNGVYMLNNPLRFLLILISLPW